MIANSELIQANKESRHDLCTTKSLHSARTKHIFKWSYHLLKTTAVMRYPLLKHATHRITILANISRYTCENQINLMLPISIGHCHIGLSWYHENNIETLGWRIFIIHLYRRNIQFFWSHWWIVWGIIMNTFSSTNTTSIRSVYHAEG